MAITFVKISEQLLTSTASSVVFSSIPQTYTDLQLILSMRGQNSGSPALQETTMQFNSDFYSANYSQQNWGYQAGTNQTNISNSNSSIQNMYIATNSSNVPNAYSAYNAYIADYADTSRPKNLIIHGGFASNAGTDTATRNVGGLWNNTAAISTITISAGGTFGTQSLFTLYGITKA